MNSNDCASSGTEKHPNIVTEITVRAIIHLLQWILMHVCLKREDVKFRSIIRSISLWCLKNYALLCHQVYAKHCAVTAYSFWHLALNYKAFAIYVLLVATDVNLYSTRYTWVFKFWRFQQQNPLKRFVPRLNFCGAFKTFSHDYFEHWTFFVVSKFQDEKTKEDEKGNLWYFLAVLKNLHHVQLFLKAQCEQNSELLNWSKFILTMLESFRKLSLL